MLPRWTTLKQEIEIKNPWWSYRMDEVQLPNGKRGEYHYVHVIGSSMIIPIRDDGRIILVNQYRYLLDKESLEFPCGGIKQGHSYDETAREELAEETGFEAKWMEAVGEHNPYNGVTDEISRVYIAKDLVPAQIHHKDDTEEFEYAYLTVDEIEDKISSGEIWDGMSLAAWAIARRKVVAILNLEF